MIRRIGSLLLVLLLGACGAEGGPRVAVLGPVEPVVLPVWQTTITPSDTLRLQSLPAALADLAPRLPARTRPLTQPDAALAYPALSPGSYRCRAVTAARRPATDFCYISETPDGLAFAKQTGANPAAGYLHLDGKRYIFLGARQRRAGENGLGYGADSSRDLVGMIERVGNFRWRLAIAGTAQPLLYELTPVPPEQQPGGRMAR
ncbi:DUF4893 domain-containing protein [Sphingomonas sp. MMS12-HWE2-04]|uniref:DUF4893 domain-containing protein n=1 Tax=Sphingomonas sp. MMS12-HWE2-04 TaxID=3234199 RepID=UPI00384CC025